MFIQTEDTVDPNKLKFIPGQEVYPNGAEISVDNAHQSPLAQKLFGLGGITKISLTANDIFVTKSNEFEWHALRPQILATIMEHFLSGGPIMINTETRNPASSESDISELEGAAAEIEEIVNTRIRPAAKDSGGDVSFKAFKNGIAYLHFEGPGYGLIQPIKNMLRHYVPELEDVRDAIDLEERPGLKTEEGKAILRLLEEQINPQVASHGGHISLIDVKADTAFVRLEGGCQGCSASSATLRQGVEIEIKKLVPSIAQVVDITDHAAGSNPYYS